MPSSSASPIETCADLRRIKAFKPISHRLATAGQPTEEEFAAIRAAGFSAVVNLVPPELAALPNEAQIVAGLGMDYVNIPVPWRAPSQHDLERFFAVMESFDDRRVFVHCAANMRVSAFVFLYRVIRLGDCPDDAEQDLLDIWNPADVWRELIDTALLRGGR